MENNMSKTKKVIKSGYNGKMYYSVFQHKKNQQFIVIWNFTETKDDYQFTANVYPYVEKEGDVHEGVGIPEVEVI
jgi:hypothetical protein